MYPQDTIDKFWTKVNKGSPDECWEWQAAKTGDGYGNVRMSLEKTKAAHRVAWELEYGSIPLGLCVLHHCDNPVCVNPAHLWIGTRADNNRDAKEKGRSRGANGERQHLSKLTASDILEIRNLYSTNRFTQSQIGVLFNMSQHAIGCVIRRETWKHIL